MDKSDIKVVPGWALGRVGGWVGLNVSPLNTKLDSPTEFHQIGPKSPKFVN